MQSSRSVEKAGRISEDLTRTQAGCEDVQLRDIHLVDNVHLIQGFFLTQEVEPVSVLLLRLLILIYRNIKVQMV